MKIRSDFVTNSSSESFGEVVIDNLVLLEILAKYKELGTFGKEHRFSIGALFDSDYYGNAYAPGNPDPEIITKTPAFQTYCALGSDTPSSLNQIIEKILEVMDDENSSGDFDEFNEELFDQLKEELIQREDEILKAFKTVKWYSRTEIHYGRFGVWEFKYSKENGEYYYEEDNTPLNY